MSTVKKVRKGMIVKADVSGTGSYVVGIVGEKDRDRVQIIPASATDIPASENIWVHRSVLEKATQSDYNDYALSASNPTQSGTISPVQDEVSSLVEDQSGAMVVATPLSEAGEEAGEEAEDPNSKIRRGFSATRLKPDLSRYVKTKTSDKRLIVDCGDKLAETIRGIRSDELIDFTAQILDDLGIESLGSGKKRVPFTRDNLVKRYSHLNKGMACMNLRNLIRGAKQSSGVTDERFIEVLNKALVERRFLN